MVGIYENEKTNNKKRKTANGGASNAQCSRLQTEFELPCVRWWGQGRLEVENHKGVLELGTEKVRLYTLLGVIKITGKNIAICHADKETVVCKGCIKNVCYED